MDLRDKWTRLCRSLGGVPADAFDTIAAHYSEGRRFYHTLDHIAALLALFDAFRPLAKDPDAVELALWFHDIVYDTRAADNEEKSARLMQKLIGSALAPGRADKVAAMILATKHDAAPTEPDTQLVVDLDLSILGAAPAEFHRYDADIRREYQWVPVPQYRAGRKAVLQHFLDRSPLYHHAPLEARFETQAKRNLSEALKKL
jgi:predicted metal-dependent HD superfamily phosphohydrolase